MSPRNTVRKSASNSTTRTPLSPEEQGHPVVEVYEGFLDGSKVATVSLTVDRQTWIAGIDESESTDHIGSFTSLDEAKYAVTERLRPASEPVQWVRRKIQT